MSEKTSPDTVPGLGFKDKEKALETLKILEGRDPDYQKLAIKGLIGRAKRTLTLTKAEDKLQNINDAVQVFEDWLKNFEKLDLSKENRAYLPLATIQTLISLKKKYSIENEKAERFLADYKSAGGDYKHLRTIASAENESSWDIVRNSNLKEILKRNEDDDADLWDDELPTKEHMELILWAYSPDATKIKKNLAKLSDLLDKDKSEESDNEENEEIETKGSKRKSDSSSSEDETPKKKSKK